MTSSSSGDGYYYSSLTTIFTTPTPCFQRLYTSIYDGYHTTDQVIVWDALSQWSEQIITQATCYPKEWAGRTSFAGAAAWSPGVCPLDYTVIATTISQDGETRAYCCPSGFSGTTGDDQCYSRVATPTVVMITEGHGPTGTQVYGNHDVVGSSTITVGNGTGILAARSLYQVLWKSSDLPRFTPASAPFLKLSCGISSVPRDPWEKTTITSMPNPGPTLVCGDRANSSSSSIVVPGTGTSAAASKHGSGRMIGIELGAVLGFLVILGLGGWLFLRNKLLRKNTHNRAYMLETNRIGL